VDKIVNNRDPDTRSGASLALGSIHSQVGGIAIGAHLKTTVGILHSLSSDNHPLVHSWALYALWLTVESSGLMFGPFINSTISLLLKLLSSDAHEAASLQLNSAVDQTMIIFYPILGKLLHALLGAIGPELQCLTRIRDLCFSIFDEFKNETDSSVVVEAIQCIQQFITFAPKHVDTLTFIPYLQKQLHETGQQHLHSIRKASVTCLYQLTRRDPQLVLNATNGVELEEQLFKLLDMEADAVVCDEIKDIQLNLLAAVALSHPSRWIDLCKNILGNSSLSPNSSSSASAHQGQTYDDDDEGENRGPSSKQANQNSVVLSVRPRWRTQVFAVQCLRKLLSKTAVEANPEHRDLAIARQKATLEANDFVVLRLSDLIKMAFNAATGTVTELQLEGLYLLQDILQVRKDIIAPAEHYSKVV
jgi:hypothetical protein